MEDATENNTALGLRDIVLDCHKAYGRDHPYHLIRPFLNPTKLRIYFDWFPGLSELAYGL